MSKIKVAVFGCTGLVGQHFIRLLDGHPIFDIAVLAASERSAGRTYREAAVWSIGGAMPASAAERIVVPATAEAAISVGAAVVFSALPASAAGPIEDDLRRLGCAVFTNASAHRGDADVPILIPEVNAGQAEMLRPDSRRQLGFIIAGSNCSTAGLALALAPFAPLGIRAVTCATYQSASGAGRKGLALLAAPVPTIIPFIPGEEDKMARETRKIFGSWNGHEFEPAPFDVAARCARVPVKEGHLLGVDIELETPIRGAEAAAILRSFRGLTGNMDLPTAPAAPIIVRDEEDRPQPALDAWAGTPERARGMAVSVGRIRAAGKRVGFFALVHNLVRGAAGACVLNAELALRVGLMANLSVAEERREARP